MPTYLKTVLVQPGPLQSARPTSTKRYSVSVLDACEFGTARASSRPRIHHHRHDAVCESRSRGVRRRRRAPSSENNNEPRQRRTRRRWAQRPEVQTGGATAAAMRSPPARGPPNSGRVGISDRPGRAERADGYVTSHHSTQPARASGTINPTGPAAQPPLASPRHPWSSVGRRSSLTNGVQKHQLSIKPTIGASGRSGNSAQDPPGALGPENRIRNEPEDPSLARGGRPG